MTNKTVIQTLRDVIKTEYKQRFTVLAEETGVGIDVIRRIARDESYSAATKNVQPLLDHFGLVLVDSRKRKGKTLN